jgi:hypothetical protein
MSAVEIKSQLHGLIDKTEDEQTLREWLDILCHKDSFYKGLSRHQIDSIQKGLKECRDGQKISHETIKSKIQNRIDEWITK